MPDPSFVYGCRMARLSPTPGRGGLRAARLEGTSTAEVAVDLMLHVPSGAPPNGGHPLILYLHGRGERIPLERIASFGPPRIAAEDPNFPWIVAAPRCPPGRGWDTTELGLLLDALEGSLPADPDRVVITGISMGGFGTWSLAMTCPERFAAAVPVCGGAPFADISVLDEDLLTRLRALPIRAYHGALDTVVPVSESEDVVAELRALGCDVDLVTYPGVGHDSWMRAYAEPNLWRWLEQQRRGPGG